MRGAIPRIYSLLRARFGTVLYLFQGDGVARKGRVVSRAELADLFGVSAPTVDRWVAQGCPVEKEGGRGRAYQFNSASVAEWRADLIRSEGRETSHAGEAELLLRELAAKTELAELKLAEAKKLVAPVEEMARAVGMANAAVRAALLAIPDRVTRLVVGEMDERKIKIILRDEIREALLSLSRAELVSEDDLVAGTDE